MSEVMRSGVIRMPYEMAMGDELSRRQFYNRAQSVLNELEEMELVMMRQGEIIRALAETIETYINKRGT
jgi:hypothetical protein